MNMSEQQQIAFFSLFGELSL